MGLKAEKMSEESLFELALETPTSERAALLERECEGRPELRRRIERLLSAHEKSDAMLDEKAAFADPGGSAAPGGGGTDAFTPPDKDVSPASTIAVSATAAEGAVVAGRYTLVHRIGEGGMGEVWVAKQEHPVKRKVALKLIKAGRDTKAVLARFEQERQALAVMDHPNIARIFDGGLTETGSPYFVMELVAGVPLTRYCDEARLGIDERLELFAAVCQAVQH